jgi:hypothetical protein
LRSRDGISIAADPLYQHIRGACCGRGRSRGARSADFYMHDFRRHSEPDRREAGAKTSRNDHVAAGFHDVPHGRTALDDPSSPVRACPADRPRREIALPEPMRQLVCEAGDPETGVALTKQNGPVFKARNADVFERAADGVQKGRWR